MFQASLTTILTLACYPLATAATIVTSGPRLPEDFDNTLPYSRRGVEIANTLNSPPARAAGYFGLATVYHRRGEREKPIPIMGRPGTPANIVAASSNNRKAGVLARRTIAEVLFAEKISPIAAQQEKSLSTTR